MLERTNQPVRIPFPDGLSQSGIATAVAEGQEIVILKQDDGYRAVDRWCPHEEGDMGEGMMYGKNIKCPVHGYIFDLAIGQCINQFTMSIAVYAVAVDGDDLLLMQLSNTKGR
jgi:nitrite reductase/ring-hydroxylating ferredoxin subunit